MSEIQTQSPSGPVLTGLRIAGVSTGLLSIVQAVLAIGFLSEIRSMFGPHQTLGFVTLAAAVVAAVFAVLWRRISGNTGLMAHAITVAVMAIAQVGIGEAGLRLPHIILGALFLVAAVALGTLTLRPGGRSSRRRTA